MSNDISVLPGGDSLMPVMSIEQAVQRRSTMVEFCKRVMVKDTDYGVIPGTERKDKDGAPSNDNATLLKPGAEKLCTLFGLRPVFEDDHSIIDFDKGLFHFSYNCILLKNARREVLDNGTAVITGDFAGSGIGSCNSLERKYRRGGKTCPACGALAIKRSKFPPKDRETGEPLNKDPGWYCHARAGGCGANFDADDPAIVDQSQQYDPAESADLINTLQKMGQKRALTSACLVATNASEFFTQDLDETDQKPARGNGQGAQGAQGGSPKKEKDSPKTITQAEAENLRKWIAHVGALEQSVCWAYKIEKIENLPYQAYGDCFKRIKDKDAKFMPADKPSEKTADKPATAGSPAVPAEAHGNTPPPQQRQPGDEEIPY